jgi:hypothetical protein
MRLNHTPHRSKAMSIHCCQVVPSSERSHRADIACRSARTVRVERTRTVGEPGLAAGATSPPPEKWNTQY